MTASAGDAAVRTRTGQRVGDPAIGTTSAREHWTGVARAFGGALFFGLPLLMTMEMWSLGFYMDRFRLALFVGAFFPVVVGLARVAGFERTTGWGEDVRDALVACFVGFVTAAGVLLLAGVLRLDSSLSEAVGTIAVTAIPCSVGAALAESILGGGDDEAVEGKQGNGASEVASYGGELFLMAAGAIFFAFNIAPTEEMLLIAIRLGTWHLVATILVSLLLMHAFVYSVEFHGQHGLPAGAPRWHALAFFTIPGYAIALLLSAWVLWTFGRFDGAGAFARVALTVVLAFPASLGAAAARLVL
jgi:putative integral membrane protein (TIGR02587 family)